MGQGTSEMRIAICRIDDIPGGSIVATPAISTKVLYANIGLMGVLVNVFRNYLAMSINHQVDLVKWLDTLRLVKILHVPGSCFRLNKLE
jgi:hypothetical protein